MLPLLLPPSSPLPAPFEKTNCLKYCKVIRSDSNVQDGFDRIANFKNVIENCSKIVLCINLTV